MDENGGMTERPIRSRAERAAAALELLTRNRLKERAVATGSEQGSGRGADMNIDAVMHGVTIGWLAQAFNMNHKSVKQKLRDCPPMFRRKTGFVYDLKMAVRYLVPPVFNVDEYLKTMKVEDLPIRLQTEFWSAKLKRQQFEEDAGQLWRTEKVVSLFGSMFQTIKYSMQLWVDNLERKTNLSVEQRKNLTEMVDSLQSEIYEKVLELQALQRTLSAREEELREEQESKARENKITQIAAEEYEDDDDEHDDDGEDEEGGDYSHLI